MKQSTHTDLSSFAFHYYTNVHKSFVLRRVLCRTAAFATCVVACLFFPCNFLSFYVVLAIQACVQDAVESLSVFIIVWSALMLTSYIYHTLLYVHALNSWFVQLMHCKSSNGLLLLFLCKLLVVLVCLQCHQAIVFYGPCSSLLVTLWVCMLLLLAL